MAQKTKKIITLLLIALTSTKVAARDDRGVPVSSRVAYSRASLIYSDRLEWYAFGTSSALRTSCPFIFEEHDLNCRQLLGVVPSRWPIVKWRNYVPFGDLVTGISGNTGCRVLMCIGRDGRPWLGTALPILDHQLKLAGVVTHHGRTIAAIMYFEPRTQHRYTNILSSNEFSPEQEEIIRKLLRGRLQ